MKFQQIDSPVFPSEDAARASVDGTLAALGKEGELEIISISVKEVAGGWVATVVVSVKEPEPETEDEGENGEGRSQKLPDPAEEYQGNETAPLWSAGAFGHMVQSVEDTVPANMDPDPVRSGAFDAAEMAGVTSADDAGVAFDTGAEPASSDSRDVFTGAERSENPLVSSPASDTLTEMGEELAADFEQKAAPDASGSQLDPDYARELTDDERRRLAELNRPGQNIVPAPENAA